MVDRDQLQAVEEQRLLQLVGDSNVVAAVLLAQLLLIDAYKLDRIGSVVGAGPFPVTHFTAAEEIGDELEAVAVPGVQERTRGRFAIEFLDGHDAGKRRGQDRHRAARGRG